MADEQAQEPQEQEETAQGNFLVIEASTGADDVPNGENWADEDGRVEASFNFAVGESLQEDIELFGEDVVRDMAHRSIVIKAQSAIRRELKNGTPPNDIPEALSDWRPDVQHTVSKDPKTSIMSNYKNLSAEDKAEMLALLQEEAEG